MDDDDVHESEDDALEESRLGGPGAYHPDTDEEKLDGDYDPPATAAPGSSSAPTDDPATDDGVEEDEAYNEGYSAASTSDNLEEDSDDAPAQPLEPEE